MLALCALSAGPASAQSKYASIVIDAGNGEVLYRANADDPKYPASLTKMMTLYLTFEALQKKRIKLGQYFPISRKAASQPPTKLDLKAGRKIRIEHAILGLVTKSANDAAMVLAEGIGGSETRFVRMMNQKARRLGMTRTTFRNPSGLPDDDQVTTARDLATLANALIRDYPKYYPYFSRASFTYQGIEHPNHNRLMEIYPGHGRSEDRLYPRVRLQPRGIGGARRTPPDRRRDGRRHAGMARRAHGRIDGPGLRHPTDPGTAGRVAPPARRSGAEAGNRYRRRQP